MGPLEGRVALVTGATRGIGRATAIELAKAGACVALNHHTSTDEAEIDEVARAISAVGACTQHVHADVSVPEQARRAIQEVVAEFGRLDVLVNNAGIVRDHSLRKLTDEEWQNVINVDLNSVFYCTSEAARQMVKQNYGRIVSISSVVALTGNFGQANYAAAKGGILAFTKTAALELAKHNVTVNAIAPGFTDTWLMQTIPPSVLEGIIARIPMGRLAKPEEIAQTVVFLAAHGDYITGQTLNVNGGLYMF
jgi:acetoacetyl-CoA reductase